MLVRYIALVFLPFILFAQKPDLFLLKSYDESINVNGWLMSEKLDGIRAYWDGENLISRNGNIFYAPVWFTKDFPSFELDGELWSKRSDFENISSITSREKPHDGWKELTYNIFEIPSQQGGLKNRLQVLEDYLEQKPNRYIKIIEQITCKDTNHLKTFLEEVEAKGGEGIVVRNPDVAYIDKRTSQALKVKSFQDEECEVIAHNEGKGKYKGILGSLMCKKDTTVFNIGSGFSDKERKNPPKIGDIVTFKYQGLTKNAKPRFPVFMRVRKER